MPKDEDMMMAALYLKYLLVGGHKVKVFLGMLLWLTMATASSLLSQPLLTVQPNLPPSEVRTMAEWEEVEAVIIAWHSYPDILTHIVREAVEECAVYIIAADPFAVNFHLQLSGVPLSNVFFIPASTNSVWVRDYGPWTVYLDQVASRGISDYLYNRPHRPNDDQLPYEIADYLGVPLYNADEAPYSWLHTGGNFLRDGMGNAYSSDLVLRENSGKTGLEIADYARVFFGINDYRLFSRLQYDTIHHLDMHMRTLDETTIAIGRYPEGQGDGPMIEANLTYLQQNARTPYGNPYQILRLPMPADGGLYPPQGEYLTYTNSVFINKKILVPIYGIPEDEEALNSYRDFFPGYDVVGINCNEMIDEVGALHCITKLVGVASPLWISHERLNDVYPTGDDYEVRAKVYHESGIDRVFLHYRTQPTAAYERIEMLIDTLLNNEYVVSLPSQEVGTSIQYYIESFAVNGKRQVRPLVAPVGYHHFDVLPWADTLHAEYLQQSEETTIGTKVLFANTTKGGVLGQRWLFPGGTPSTSIDENVSVTYAEPGSYDVQLIVDNPLASDTLLNEQAVHVFEALAPDEVNTEEWRVSVSNNQWPRWEVQPIPSCHEFVWTIAHRSSSSRLNRSYLKTAVDLSGYSHSHQPYLSFDVAYAMRDANHFDELRVNLIDEDGHKMNIYNKGGDVLAERTDFVLDFEPMDCDDWRQDHINLSRWNGQVIQLEIESIGDRGNTVYLSGVKVTANTLPEVVISSPAQDTTYVSNGGINEVVVVADAIDPDGSIDRVDFFVANEWVGVDSVYPYEQLVSMEAAGEYPVYAVASDNEGAEHQSNLRYLYYDIHSSVPSIALGVTLQIAPNPLSGTGQLIVESPQAYKGTDISVLNMKGQLLMNMTVDIPRGHSVWPINVNGLAAAPYRLHIVHSAGEQFIAFVKQ